MCSKYTSTWNSLLAILQPKLLSYTKMAICLNVMTSIIKSTLRFTIETEALVSAHQNVVLSRCLDPRTCHWNRLKKSTHTKTLVEQYRQIGRGGQILHRISHKLQNCLRFGNLLIVGNTFMTGTAISFWDSPWSVGLVSNESPWDQTLHIGSWLAGSQHVGGRRHDGRRWHDGGRCDRGPRQFAARVNFGSDRPRPRRGARQGARPDHKPQARRRQ